MAQAQKTARHAWTGIKVLSVFALVILTVLYSRLDTKQDRLFWIVVTCFYVAILIQVFRTVKNAGGHAIGLTTAIDQIA